MTNAELAVLSLLAEQPRHGYDMEQVIGQRNMRQWTEIGFSSIYAILRRLERAGWAEGQAAHSPGRGPGRKVYRLTAQGRAAWEQAMLQALETPLGSPPPLLLGLASLPALPSPAVLQALRNCRGQLEEQAEHLRQRQVEEAYLPEHVRAMFELSLGLNQAELEWIEVFLGRLEADHGEI